MLLKQRQEVLKKIKKSSKKESSLTALSKRFISIIEKQPNKKITFEQAQNELKVQKRRIYDIINILEGVGYIYKIGKNQFKVLDQRNEQELKILNENIVADEKLI